jgi:hypothetical protein
VNSASITDGEATSNISPGLFDEAATFVAGMLKDAGNATGAITLAIDRFTEIEFAIQATGNATPGGNYCFQLYDSTAAAPLDTYVCRQPASPLICSLRQPAPPSSYIHLAVWTPGGTTHYLELGMGRALMGNHARPFLGGIARMLWRRSSSDDG